MFGKWKSSAKLILASGSARRAEILRNAGFEFETLVTHADESRRTREAPAKYVGRVAHAKARAAAEKLRGKSDPVIVIGADTVVLAGGKILGKPLDVKDARRMLRLLSGKTHRVLTGLAVVSLPDGAGRQAAFRFDRQRLNRCESGAVGRRLVPRPARPDAAPAGAWTPPAG